MKIKTNLAPSIPAAAQKLLDAMSTCTEEKLWVDNDMMTYIHPLGEIVFQGMVRLSAYRHRGRWFGDKEMYQIAYAHPHRETGVCDVYLFELDEMENAA